MHSLTQVSDSTAVLGQNLRKQIAWRPNLVTFAGPLRNLRLDIKPISKQFRGIKFMEDSNEISSVKLHNKLGLIAIKLEYLLYNGFLWHYTSSVQSRDWGSTLERNRNSVGLSRGCPGIGKNRGNGRKKGIQSPSFALLSCANQPVMAGFSVDLSSFVLCSASVVMCPLACLPSGSARDWVTRLVKQGQDGSGLQNKKQESDRTENTLLLFLPIVLPTLSFKNRRFSMFFCKAWLCSTPFYQSEK